jgi:hypothetical protein
MLADPLSAVPLRALSLLAENDDPTRAKRLMDLAAQRVPRDVASQIWLADEYLLRGEAIKAMRHVDALLRVWPELSETLFPVLQDLTQDVEGAIALVSTLQLPPPWRESFLAALPRNRERPAADLADFYEAMGTGPAPLSMSELRPYLEALIQQGQAKMARARWLDLAPSETKLGEVPYNGGFEREPLDAPFDWTIQAIRGARAHLTSDIKGGRVLTVQFYRTRVPFRHVSQTLLLEPGAYILSGEVAARSLENPRGLQWTISCAGGRQERLGETRRVSGTLKWEPFELEFHVPQEAGCEAQVLRLELPARIAAEQEISGDILFDDLRIVPTATSAQLE